MILTTKRKKKFIRWIKCVKNDKKKANRCVSSSREDDEKREESHTVISLSLSLPLVLKVFKFSRIKVGTIEKEKLRKVFFKLLRNIKSKKLCPD